MTILEILQSFCGTDDFRSYLHKPFSRDDYTYAADGSACVRVPRLQEVPEQDDPKKPDVSSLPFSHESTFEAVTLTLPPKKPESVEACGECYDGMEHDCPDCECICDECDGSGKIKLDGDDNHSVDVFGQPFALHYVRMLAALPGLRTANADEILRFQFDGGEGILMGLRCPRENHITNAVLPAPPSKDKQP